MPVSFSIRYPLFAAMVLFTAQRAVAHNNEDAPPQLGEKLEEYMQAAIRHDQFSGSLLVARAGLPLFSKGFGMANYELKVPNTPTTVFSIASLTKPFTALAIMQLKERGKLKLDDAICQHLTDCPAGWQPITIRHLLTHTSGIMNVSSLPDWDDRISRLPYTRAAFVKVFRDLPLQFAPGSQFKYSNSGYYLLGLIIERASAMPYQTYLRENIFAPLAMHSTAYYEPPALVPNRATGYYWAENGFVNAPVLNQSLTFSAGGIVSTTEDLLRWDQALYTETLVSHQSLNEIFSPFLSSYAYGWKIGAMHDRAMAGHSGSYNGFSSFLARFPAERVTIIVLSNSDRTSATKVARDVAAIVFNAPYQLPKPQIADLLSQALVKQPADVAVHELREIIRTRSADYNLDHQEEAINDLGYALLEAKKVNDAITIFRFNIDMAPQSANAHDSLAEAYLANGNKTLAIAHYETSLAMDPDNQNAVRMLEKLRAMN